MIQSWTWPAYVAVLLGGAMFVVLFGPLLAFQSRQFGRLTLSRTLATAGLSIYLVAIIAFTLLPLPSRSICETQASRPVQWTPLHSIQDILTDTQGMSALTTLRSTVVLQVVFNVMLFIPWGAFVRRYFGRSILLATISGLVVSTFIEVTQATGIWGIYDCAYRFGDVDDVITNTVGALIGALVAPLVLGWLPSAAVDAARRHEPRPVTAVRRLAGMVIDVTAFGLLMTGLTVSFRVFVAFGLGRPLPNADSWLGTWVWAAVSGAVLIVIPALLGHATFGQRAVWLAPEYPDRSPVRRLTRVVLGSGSCVGLFLVATAPPLVDNPVADWVSVAGLGWAGVTAIVVLADRSRRGPSLLAAGARVIDSRSTRGREDDASRMTG